MPDHTKIPLQQVVPRAHPEAIKLMDEMLNYNPKKRPKPSQVLAHPFFHPKTSLGTQISPKTPNPRSSQDTTADSGKQKVESIIIGSNNIQIVNKFVEKTRPGNSISPERPVPLIEVDKRKSIDPGAILNTDKTPDQNAAMKYDSSKKPANGGQLSRNNRLEPISIDKTQPVTLQKVNVNDTVLSKDKVVSNFVQNGPVAANHMMTIGNGGPMPKMAEINRNANASSVLDETSPVNY